MRASVSWLTAYPINKADIVIVNMKTKMSSGSADVAEVPWAVRSAARLDAYMPSTSTPACTNTLRGEISPTQAGPTPSRFDPLPSGSEITGNTYENLVNAKEIVNAIQAHRPSGTSTSPCWASAVRMDPRVPAIFRPVHTARA